MPTRETGNQDRLALIELMEHSIKCSTEDEFKDLIRRHVRPLLPHGCMIAAVGHLIFGMIAADVLLGVDYPLGMIEGLRDGTRMTERAFMMRWYESRKPQAMDLRVNPELLSPLEREEAERYELQNIVAHGLVDIDGRAGSYFSFSRLPEPPGETECRVLEQIVPHLHQALTRSVPFDSPALESVIELTARELEILHCLVDGYAVKHISSLLGTSQRTIRTQLHSIYRKLGVSGKGEAIARTYEIGLDKFGK